MVVWIRSQALSEENLRKLNIFGHSVFWEAACHGYLDTIPTELITEANMLFGESHHWEWQNETPLYAAITGTKRQQFFELALGIEFSEAIIPIVGSEWFIKNQQICEQKKLAMAGIETHPVTANLDIF